MLPVSEGWTFDEIKAFSNVALLADFYARDCEDFPLGFSYSPTKAESWAWAEGFLARQLPRLFNGISDDRLDEMKTFYLERFHD